MRHELGELVLGLVKRVQERREQRKDAQEMSQTLGDLLIEAGLYFIVAAWDRKFSTEEKEQLKEYVAKIGTALLQEVV